MRLGAVRGFANDTIDDDPETFAFRCALNNHTGWFAPGKRQEYN